MLEIVRLEAWYPQMAAKWTNQVRVPWTDREAFVHHHTAGGTGQDPLSYARSVADFHWGKWSVPGGYAVLVGTDGVLREMSGLDYQGVHAGTHYWNRRGLGLAYQGDFRTSPPSDVMLAAAAGLIAAHSLDQTYHRAVRPEFTHCPGDALIRLLPLEVDMLTEHEEATVKAMHRAWTESQTGSVEDEMLKIIKKRRQLADFDPSSSGTVDSTARSIARAARDRVNALVAHLRKS